MSVIEGTRATYSDPANERSSLASGRHHVGVLNAKQRKASATVKSGGKAKYPIPDKNHARMALSMMNQAKPPLTAAQKAKVRAKAEAMLHGKGK